jgi:hypothetical protein
MRQDKNSWRYCSAASLFSIARTAPIGLKHGQKIAAQHRKRRDAIAVLKFYDC